MTRRFVQLRVDGRWLMSEVLLILANGGPGGMQRVVSTLALGLRSKGVDVAVAVGGDLPVHGLGPGSGVPLLRLPAFSGRTGGSSFARALRKLVRRERPVVLHGHGLRLAPLLRLCGRGVVVRLVTCHGLDPTTLSSVVRPLRLAHIRVAACGEGPLQLLHEAGVDVFLLPVGIGSAPLPLSRSSLAESFAFDPGRPIVAAALRLTPQKDPATMIRAVAALPDVQLVICGDGPLERDVLRLVDELHASGRVRLAGYRSDARAILGASDAVLLSSVWEGHVLVGLEAMSAGVPLVATACPGIKEWTEDGVNILLAPVGDSGALGRQLEKALTDQSLRLRLISGGAEVAARHTIDTMVASHLDAYGISPGG
ncbi:MAG: glycosyltransferase family 4 protein [Actinomycetota bacterium]